MTLLLSWMLFSCRKHYKLNIVAVPVDSEEVAFTFKSYIECSGSMNGYMCDGSEMRDLLYDYISTIEPYADTVSLYFINSGISPYKGAIENYATFPAFQHATGNKSHSDIADMLSMIINQQDSQTVSMFTSDCILDVPDGAAPDYMNNRSIKIKNTFARKLREQPDFAVCIYRLESKYRGAYYYAHSSVPIDTIRPYYLWVMGNKKAIAAIQSRYPNSSFKHGIKDVVAFNTETTIPCTLMQGAKETDTAVLKTSRRGFYSSMLKVDLSATLQDESYLTNISNYAFSQAGIQVTGVRRIQTSDHNYTHVVDLSIDSNVNSVSGTLDLLPTTPQWIEAANDDEGTDVFQHIYQTFGIKYIIGGVADAYKDVTSLAKITLTVL